MTSRIKKHFLSFLMALFVISVIQANPDSSECLNFLSLTSVEVEFTEEYREKY